MVIEKSENYSFDTDRTYLDQLFNHLLGSADQRIPAPSQDEAFTISGVNQPITMFKPKRPLEMWSTVTHFFAATIVCTVGKSPSLSFWSL
jgi:hypothetical protein